MLGFLIATCKDVKMMFFYYIFLKNMLFYKYFKKNHANSTFKKTILTCFAFAVVQAYKILYYRTMLFYSLNLIHIYIIRTEINLLFWLIGSSWCPLNFAFLSFILFFSFSIHSLTWLDWKRTISSSGISHVLVNSIYLFILRGILKYLDLFL